MDSVNRYLALQKIVELGCFTRAVEAPGYTRSAMSQMIASLEGDLSIKLLIRSRTGAQLTLEWAELYPYVERLVYQYWTAQEKAGEIKGLETGVVRMGTLASISAHWLPDLLRDFQFRYPAVEFMIHQGDYTSHSGVDQNRDSGLRLRESQSRLRFGNPGFEGGRYAGGAAGGTPSVGAGDCASGAAGERAVHSAGGGPLLRAPGGLSVAGRNA